jgi:hypothetical protein
MAVVLKEQQRIAVGADQDIGIGQQPGSEAGQRGHADIASPGDALRGNGADDALGQGVHIRRSDNRGQVRGHLYTVVGHWLRGILPPC